MMSFTKILLAAGCVALPATAAKPLSVQDAAKALSAIPAWFEPNIGQAAPSVRYLSRGGNGTLLVESSRAVYRTAKGSLSIRFAGASAGVVEGSGVQPARGSYWIGNDRQRWRSDVTHFAEVHSRGIYPGVDVAYHMASGELEYDLVVHPGGDPNRIRLSFAGAGRPRIDSDGDLVFQAGLRHKKPVAYQDLPSGRVPVNSQYVLTAGGEVSFGLGAYDRNHKLIIDPVLQSGYLGGDRADKVNAIAIDAQGTIWVAGASASSVVVEGGITPIQEASRGGTDVFLAGLRPNPTGRLILVYWTLMGGDNDDEATAVTFDSQGFIYLAGRTASADFPRAAVPLQPEFGGETDAFIATIRPADRGGDALWYSQIYGGAKLEAATSIAVDNQGVIYFAGNTTSDGLAGTGDGRVQGLNRGGFDGFVVKANTRATGSTSIVYATYFGGKSTDSIRAIAIDAAGTVYFTGYTASDDFPVTVDAFVTSLQSMYVASINPNRPGLDGLEYCTYLGGGGLTSPTAMAFDGTSNLWITGYTFSPDFPVTMNAHRTALAGNADAFVMRFDYSKRTTPEAIAYSTLVGGREGDVPQAIAIGRNGTVAIAGYTYSPDFPLVDTTLPPRPRSADAAFAAVLDPARSGDQALAYSSVFSGALIENATAIAVNAAGNLVVGGYTYSADFPVTDQTEKLAPGGATQGFLMVIQPR